MMRRHRARILALQALYEIDAVRREPDSALNHLIEEAEITDETAAFSRELVTGVIANLADIDKIISKHATSWPLEQISVIDRNILRLAIFEILFDNKVPVKVAASEAVKLANSFGSETSAKFVNGVLGSICATVSR